jgi:GTP cyclohydrolase I
VIPITIGATGTISKSFRKYVSNIPGNHEVKELQKTAILDTAHILRKMLTYRYNGVNAENSNIRSMNSYNTVFPRDMVCLRNISVETLHTKDDDDDDNNNKFGKC